jgi:hypothetical protein
MVLLHDHEAAGQLQENAQLHAFVAEQIPDRLQGKTPQPARSARRLSLIDPFNAGDFP